jgi:hypothetical protein
MPAFIIKECTFADSSELICITLRAVTVMWSLVQGWLPGALCVLEDIYKEPIIILINGSRIKRLDCCGFWY